MCGEGVREAGDAFHRLGEGESESPHGLVPSEMPEWESIFLELSSCPYFGD